MTIHHQEKGRTMVEILAVVAIMGILSLGMLKGYDYLISANDASKIVASSGEVFAIAKVKGRVVSSAREHLSKTLPNPVKEISVTPQGLATVTLIKCIPQETIAGIHARYGYCVTVPDDMKNNDGSLKLLGQESDCSFTNPSDLFEITIDLAKTCN